ncbi:MAG: BON domain-containing protein [Burkholderiales bacterium]|nr:BON domain-containing protein [Burkholderiales bacterium]
MQLKFNKLRLSYFNLWSSCLLAIGLNGCAAVIVGAVAGAAGTTAVVATDPRTSGAVVDDNTIQTKLTLKYNDYPDSNIYVHSYNGEVLLTGQVPNTNVRESAEFAAKSTPGVRQIYDYLEIRLPQSFSSATADSYTTTQVRAKILKLPEVDSNSVKVVTTNDVVYLSGVVTQEQAKKIANAAAATGGVKKVVTLFQYVTNN